MEKIYSKDEIKAKIETNDTWLIRGLLKIYQMQTEEEKFTGLPEQHNGVGFSGFDSEILTSFAKQVLSSMEKGIKLENSLSPKQKEIARKKMIRYAGQLFKISGMAELTKQAKKEEKEKFKKSFANLKAGMYQAKKEMADRIKFYPVRYVKDAEEAFSD